jgi:hypothetical protein
MTLHIDPRAVSRAYETLQQADELLKIFAETDWEDLTSQHKIAAGLLGKWVCDKCLRVLCEASGQAIPASADLPRCCDSRGQRDPDARARGRF